MKNIATGDVLERIRRLAPSHVTAPFKTVAEWREWQLSEGQKRCEEINRQNRQLRVEKILNRSGIQPLHRKCSFSNYQVQNEGQRYALSQAKSIADELMTGVQILRSAENLVPEEPLSGSYRESPAERRSDSDCGYRG